MRILKVEPGQVPYEKEISNTLESIQAEVGSGLFQPLYVGEGIVLCCNEEGKLNGMEPNRRLGNDIVCGPFFLVGDSESGDFVSLTDDQLALGWKPLRNRSGLPVRSRSLSRGWNSVFGKEV